MGVRSKRVTSWGMPLWAILLIMLVLLGGATASAILIDNDNEDEATFRDGKEVNSFYYEGIIEIVTGDNSIEIIFKDYKGDDYDE